MTCTICGGPAHPATGAQYSERTIVCRACVVELWTWLLNRLRGKPRGGKGPNFYDHAGKGTTDD